MKVLIAYPNLPMMIIPAVSVGLFTGICKSLNVDVELFETTAYSDDPNKGMLYKTKIGGGRAYTPKDLGMELKPTNAMMDDFLKKVEQYKPDLVLFSTVEDTFKDTVIMPFYESNPMLEYVLLVGDVNGSYAMPTFTIPSYNEEDIDVTDYPIHLQTISMNHIFL